MKSPEINIINICLINAFVSTRFLSHATLRNLTEWFWFLNIHNAKPSKPSTSLSSASYHTTSYRQAPPVDDLGACRGTAEDLR